MPYFVWQTLPSLLSLVPGDLSVEIVAIQDIDAAVGNAISLIPCDLPLKQLVFYNQYCDVLVEFFRMLML